MKSNSKEVRELIKLHIVECVEDYNGLCENINQASDFLFNDFDRVANHENNKKRFPNDQDRFSNYLSGLPFNFHYYTDDVINFLNGLGINPTGKEFSAEKSFKMYHYLIYAEMLKNKTK